MIKGTAKVKPLLLPVQLLRDDSTTMAMTVASVAPSSEKELAKQKLIAEFAEQRHVDAKANDIRRNTPGIADASMSTMPDEQLPPSLLYGFVQA